MRKIHICSLQELITLLQNKEIDLDCSFAIISSSYPLSTQHRPVSLMTHVACTYQDIDFDFRGEGLSLEAAAGFAEDIKRRSSTIKNWYFVSDRGVRRSAAICCAALRYWGQTEQEMAIWSAPEREPNISVYIRMCQALGVPIGNIELNRRIYVNHIAIKTALQETE